MKTSVPTLNASDFDACLFHADCPDGFGGAWAVRNAGGRNLEFVPVRSGDAPDPVRWKDRRLLLVDFCWLPEAMRAVATEARSVVVLDHHASAQKAYEDVSIPNVETIFDLDRSGATMAWAAFHPGEPLPDLLAYVEDHDLWRHALPGSADVNLSLTSRPFAFEEWDRYDVADLRADGEAVSRWMDHQIDRLARSASEIGFLGHVVPAVNAPRLLVDRLGHRLAANAPFAVVWAVSGGKVHASLRSRPDGMRVDELVASHGGRGHPHAAILSLPLDVAEGASLLRILAGGPTSDP